MQGFFLITRAPNILNEILYLILIQESSDRRTWLDIFSGYKEALETQLFRKEMHSNTPSTTTYHRGDTTYSELFSYAHASRFLVSDSNLLRVCLTSAVKK